MYDIDALISRITALAPLPSTYYELNNSINNPSSSLKDIGNIINRDVSLTAQLLRIANSALFNFPAKITSVSQAITVIGIQQLKELTLACTVLRAFPSITEEDLNIDDFWRHSLAVAVASRILARHRKESNIEHYYVLGLLHDIGRIVMFLGDPKRAHDLQKNFDHTCQLMHNLEFTVWDTDHGNIGAKFLESWNLPASIWEPLRHHHHPEKAESYQDECAIIHVADIIVHTLELGYSGDQCVPPISDIAWQRLGIETDKLPEIVNEIEHQFEESVGLFKSNLH